MINSPERIIANMLIEHSRFAWRAEREADTRDIARLGELLTEDASFVSGKIYKTRNGMAGYAMRNVTLLTDGSLRAGEAPSDNAAVSLAGITLYNSNQVILPNPIFGEEFAYRSFMHVVDLREGTPAYEIPMLPNVAMRIDTNAVRLLPGWRRRQMAHLARELLAPPHR